MFQMMKSKDVVLMRDERAKLRWVIFVGSLLN